MKNIDWRNNRHLHKEHVKAGAEDRYRAKRGLIELFRYEAENVNRNQHLVLMCAKNRCQ